MIFLKKSAFNVQLPSGKADITWTEKIRILFSCVSMHSFPLDNFEILQAPSFEFYEFLTIVWPFLWFSSYNQHISD